jgi:DNA polymerase III delta prime subunit
LDNISKRLLSGAAKSGRVSNAYLFVGADTEELLEEAELFAKELNTAPHDLLVISASGKSIKIEQIQDDLIKFVKFGPVGQGWKVIIVHEADQMTEQASNSFLKTLEEPLNRILFILTTNRESKILRTIASRCQKVMFYGEKAAPDENASDLADKILNIDKMSIPQALAISDELSGDPDIEDKLNSVLYSIAEKTGPGSGKKLMMTREIFNALRGLERKGNKRLALDSMFLSLKEAADN